MRMTESRLRSIIRGVIKESIDNQNNSIECKGIKFKDFKVNTQNYRDAEVSVSYKVNDQEKSYEHENYTGSYEGLAYDIMDNLEKLSLVVAGSSKYEDVEDFLIDVIKERIYSTF